MACQSFILRDSLVCPCNRHLADRCDLGEHQEAYLHDRDMQKQGCHSSAIAHLPTGRGGRYAGKPTRSERDSDSEG